jgi:hypothetical protein
VLVRAAFRSVPALKRWQALALPTKLVDARDAVRVDVTTARRRVGVAVGNGGGEWAAGALTRIAPSASVSASVSARVSASASVSARVSASASVSARVSASVSASVGANVSASVSASVSAGVGASVGAVSVSVSASVGANVRRALSVDSVGRFDAAFTGQRQRKERDKPSTSHHPAFNLAIQTV